MEPNTVKEHNDSEKLASSPANDALEGYDTVENWEKHKGRGFWGNNTTGYLTDEEVNNMPD